MKRLSVALLLLAASGLSSPARVCRAEPPGRYLAVFEDGTRVQGNVISGWHVRDGDVKLDETSLLAPGRRLRWLRDTKLPPADAEAYAGGLVEFTGGDRLPGKVVGFVPGKPTAWGVESGELLIRPMANVAPFVSGRPANVRVLPEHVRRLVLSGKPRRELHAATVFCRDGRTLAFRRLRWESDAVRLLTQEGLLRLPFAALAEIHLPPSDVWEQYYRQLALLAPGGEARILRFETADGLIVTSSADRFQVALTGEPRQAEHWYHVVQPVWSRYLLWVGFPQIRTRWSFALHEVPLSQFRPHRVVQRSWLSQGRTWQSDRNVQGGPLRSGGRLYGWGFGVHAANELAFPLPRCVRGFRTRVGIDRISGGGGCVVAKIEARGAQRRLLYRSKHLIGSQETVEAGRIALAGPDAGQDELVLIAEAAHDGRPPGADPLDIRDSLDWLEPLLLLDPAGLRREVAKYLPENVPAWRGWTVRVEGGGPVPLAVRWDESNPAAPRFVVDLVSRGKAITLSRQCEITADAARLTMIVRQAISGARPGQLEARLDGKPIARSDVPAFGSTEPLSVSLKEWMGKRCKLEVVYAPGEAHERLEWQSLALTP